MFKKINNVLDKDIFDNINEEVSSNNFPWYYLPDSSTKLTTDNKTKKYSFHHTTMCVSLFGDKRSNSYFNESTIKIAEVIKDKFNLIDFEIIRLRWGMITSYGEKIINTPHIDTPVKHKVILYYLNKCDGDTYFYDDKYNIINQNTPEENSAILFDGNIKHSSSKPIMYDRRIVLNINLQKEI